MRASDSVEVIDLEGSQAYRRAHIPGAWFALRARLEEARTHLPAGRPVVLTSADGVVWRAWPPARARTPPGSKGAPRRGSPPGWTPEEGGAGRMATAPDDVWLRPYERDGDPTQAMKAYLEWELALVRQIEADGTARFRRFAT